MPKNKRLQTKIGQAVAAGLSSDLPVSSNPTQPNAGSAVNLDTGRRPAPFPTKPEKGNFAKGGPQPNAPKIRQSVQGLRGRLKTLKAVDPAERSEKQVSRLTSLRSDLSPLRAARTSAPKLFPGSQSNGSFKGNVSGGLKPKNNPANLSLDGDWRRKRR